jgi:hypothetical protein
MDKLAPHSEVHGSLPEVNHGVVYRNSVFLPGEASQPCLVRLKSAGMDKAAAAAMPLLSCEESAEGVVVVSEPVSSWRLVGVDEECGKSVRSKARTKEGEATGGVL